MEVISLINENFKKKKQREKLSFYFNNTSIPKGAREIRKLFYCKLSVRINKNKKGVLKNFAKFTGVFL